MDLSASVPLTINPLITVPSTTYCWSTNFTFYLRCVNHKNGLQSSITLLQKIVTEDES